jgi:hypothetical protein
MGRVTSLVTLHSPHLGSGIASLGASIDALLARVQALLTAAGVPPPGFLMMLRGMVLNPAIAELVIGSPTAGVAAGEPVPGVTYHTFGGTSTAFARLWANAYTPDSFVPWPVPFPLFHWGMAPVLAGVPLDAASFIPAGALLAPFPPVTELATVLGTLVASTPELAPGSGDVLVTDARARLPFSASHTTNPLNHAEALWDRTLQAQVISILSRLRAPGASGQAVARITPYPVRQSPAQYTVTAADVITGAPITTGSVTVRDTFGGIALQTALATPFTFTFRGRRIIEIEPDGHRDQETVFPTVEANLPVPYGSVEVDTGQA